MTAARSAVQRSMATALLLNCAAYLLACLIVSRWDSGIEGSRRAVLTVIAALSFVPTWVLWSTQPLKDAVFVALTLLSAGASALAALIAFRHEDTSAMAEAVLACGAAIAAAWLGRSASRAAQQWQDELVAWHGNDVALLLDEGGRILDANDRAAEAYGLPGDALYRRAFRELRHPDAEDDLEARFAELRARGHLLFETVQRRGDGSPFPAEVSARVVRVRGHDLLHRLGRGGLRRGLCQRGDDLF